MLYKSNGWLKDKHFLALQELLLQERWEKGICMCVCVCVCARARVCARMLNFKMGSKAYKKDN